jgi:membrane-bound lytic murein transglycosylase B
VVISSGASLARVGTDARVETGRLQLSARALPLLAVESTYGVDRHLLTAIWAIESNYGSALGDRNVIRSLATLAAGDPRRGSFWRQELLTALSIIERGETTPDRMVGSWAGAMGHTQFMPSTYTRHAVDFDGDGRRDIWTNPLDALASAANYLKVSGWRPDRPWGLEVALPPGFDLATVDPAQKRSWQAWGELAVRPANPKARVSIAAGEPMHLLLPAGIDGPAFLVTRNFEAVLRYNNATSYALAVGHLADRLAGGEPLVRAFPVSDQPLGLADRTELQTRLAALGHDTGTIDGMIGTRTRTAIRAFQIARGLPADGYPSQRLLDELRRPVQP